LNQKKDSKFLEKLKNFKKFKTFIDIKDILKELNIFSNNNYSSSIELLKIRDHIKALENELAKL